MCVNLRPQTEPRQCERAGVSPSNKHSNKIVHTHFIHYLLSTIMAHKRLQRPLRNIELGHYLKYSQIKRWTPWQKKRLLCMAFRRTEVKVMILHLKRDLKWCPAPHTLGHPIITPFEFIIRGSKLDLGACPGKYCALGMLAVPDCLTVCLFGGADGF